MVHLIQIEVTNFWILLIFKFKTENANIAHFVYVWKNLNEAKNFQARGHTNASSVDQNRRTIMDGKHYGRTRQKKTNVCKENSQQPLPSTIINHGPNYGPTI